MINCIWKHDMKSSCEQPHFIWKNTVKSTPWLQEQHTAADTHDMLSQSTLFQAGQTPPAEPRCCKYKKHQKANSSYINDVIDVMNLWCKRAIFPALTALEGGLSYPCIVFGARVTCIPGIRNGTILWPQIFTWSAVARSKFPPFPCTLHGRQTFQQSWWVCQRSCPQFLSWPRRRGGEEEDTLHSFLSWKHLPLSSSLIPTTMCVGFPSTIQSTNGSMKLLWDLVMAALYFKCSVCTCFHCLLNVY